MDVEFSRGELFLTRIHAVVNRLVTAGISVKPSLQSLRHCLDKKNDETAIGILLYLGYSHGYSNIPADLFPLSLPLYQVLQRPNSRGIATNELNLRLEASVRFPANSPIRSDYGPGAVSSKETVPRFSATICAGSRSFSATWKRLLRFPPTRCVSCGTRRVPAGSRICCSRWFWVWRCPRGSRTCGRWWIRFCSCSVRRRRWRRWTARDWAFCWRWRLRG